ncbi:PilZ domain-containing protein [Geothrix sp. 21YS21S-2]|uniref:PilZ domain-containing protein n=1 Tax=Geothrix sp. 21YS21S-2 TaxID=3068893 RepID=UPI0027B9B590|nr:PilZ domain-containing protein [Geothrix sp. 21YS21S-2]
MSGTIESRTAKRIPVENRVTVMVKGKAILAAIAVNISMGGLLLTAAEPLPVGSQCEVAIALPEGDGAESFVTQGRVVRAGEKIIAIQFARMLGDQTIGVITAPSTESLGGSLVRAYVNYFKVSQSRIGYDCERLFGVTSKTFRTISTTSFIACIPAAIVPVWALRAFIPAVPDWAKIIAAFVYGAIWLLVLQPFIDLGIFKLIQQRSRSART